MESVEIDRFIRELRWRKIFKNLIFSNEFKISQMLDFFNLIIVTR